MPRVSFAIQFEWDPRKAQTNRTKHGVGFELAVTVFQDPNQLTLHDAQHSADEDRWITLGRDRSGMLLVVVHTWDERSGQSVLVRVISARAATTREKRHYEIPS